MKIGAIIQARMSSKRFPGKVLHKVAGKPMLQYLLEGMEHCKNLDTIVVATSVADSDSAIEDHCKEFGVSCVRGSLDNVAARFVEVLDKFEFEAFVRLNGDSPLLDYRIVTLAVDTFRAGSYDLVTNVLKRTFPKGQSVEVIRTETFLNTYPLIHSSHDREHVTSYFYNHQSDFSIFNFELEKSQGHVQLSVDTLNDMRKFDIIADSLRKPHWEYTFEEVLGLLR
ncbi:MAG: NTP transferase domain-containing protein [Deltaproteobacteria bacterium]|nr:NTP transferase domain-containing protein [Deltaproteobacteria bacterium]